MTPQPAAQQAEQSVDLTSLLLDSTNNNNKKQQQQWMRGVNLGGWLVLERYIVPYQFAVTDCHLDGHLCWYPGQAAAHNNNKLCDSKNQCRAYQEAPATDPTHNTLDYPLDEYTLGRAFLQRHQNQANNYTLRNPRGVEIAEQWFNSHFDHFITPTDIATLAKAGVTHLRVPLPHWILGNVLPHEPWIVGNRWPNFLSLLQTARTLHLQVWPDIHTAPGGQNHFDNGGRADARITCTTWSSSPSHVQRSLDVIANVTQTILEAGFSDVVTGFGLLNEPFKDCDQDVYRAFVQRGKEIVQQTLGANISVYVSDMFTAKLFNDGGWWLDAAEYNNTYLDSHYYHVFAEYPRELSPRQHIAFTCQHDWQDFASCCYEDAKRQPWYRSWFQSHNTVPSKGVRHIVGEWSAAFDTLPVARLQQIMAGIQNTGVAPFWDKQFTKAEKDFLKHFVQAQMVVYESADLDISSGWFYWTAKMEGGGFAEWDFLRGLEEGWIPNPLPGVNQTSQELYGTCYDILFKTSDDSKQVIHTLPDPNHLDPSVWLGPLIDDDVVSSHGDSLLERDGIHHIQRHYPRTSHYHSWPWIVLGIACAILAKAAQRYSRRFGKQSQYSEIGTVEV